VRVVYNNWSKREWFTTKAARMEAARVVLQLRVWLYDNSLLDVSGSQKQKTK
jgi:hypothetical protein